MALKYEVSGKTLEFDIVKRKNQKRVIFHAIGQHHFKVTTPYRASSKMIEKAIKHHIEAILKLKPRHNFKDLLLNSETILLFGKPRQLSELIDISTSNQENALLNIIKITFQEKLNVLITHFNHLDDSLKLEEVKFRLQYMTSKYGSCQPSKKHITLNLELAHYPKEALEYIFAHEIAHLKHPNHSKHFYAYLTTIMPDHKARKKQLELWHKTLIYEGFNALINVTNQL